MGGKFEKVDHAIILAGGRGTRMLPASRYTSKEFLPLVDVPLINHLIWEACKAEVKNIHIVLSSQKLKIYKEIMDNSDDLNDIMAMRPDIPKDIFKLNVSGVKIFLHEQINPNGMGGALSVVLEKINSPFILLLGDNVILDNHPKLEEMGILSASNCSKKLVTYFYETGTPCAGLMKVEKRDVSKYGIVEISNGLINSIVEKPKISDALTNYALCGRYLLPANTAEILSRYPVDIYGELQSIELLNHIITQTGLGGIILDNSQLYDSGDPLSWIKSQVDHAIRREDIRADFLPWLSSRILEK